MGCCFIFILTDRDRLEVKGNTDSKKRFSFAILLKKNILFFWSLVWPSQVI